MDKITEINWKMANVDLKRSIQFVSLDTHPANNALVVTYEILVSITDPSTKREIARRNKRDQLQINISALDSLKEDDLKADKLAFNLQDLSTQIIRKCPLLLSERNNLDDIQLHLLYLINRRQSQLLTRVGGEISQNRPPSSASARIRSAQSSRISSRNARRSSLVSTGEHFHETKIGDIYCYLHAKENSDEAQNLNTHIEEFLNCFDEYLVSIEQFKAKNIIIQGEKIEKLDQYLEGLYGETDERYISMILIRKLCKDDVSLSKICLNKLLTCAMFRTLRESEGKDYNLSELILYCLIRFTYFVDSYQVFVNVDQVDLMKIVVDFLVDLSKNLKSNQSQELKLLQDNYYYTNSFLIIVINLLRVDNAELSIKNKILKQYGKVFLNTLIELFKLNTKYVTRDIRLLSKPERIIKTQSRIVFILTQLSVFKDFISLIRGEHQSIFDSIVCLINILQLSRPGSGASNTDSSRIVSDKQLLYELLELEVDIFRLINNLIFDHKLKIKLLRKNLLKCVLRNLVVFLASRKLNTLNPFDKSFMLVAPFKCLYELSGANNIKTELYKSKIILKCLLEYLLSSAVDLKPALDLRHASSGEESARESEIAVNQLDPPDQIIIEPTTASHYIIGLWVNLSVNSEATIYGDDTELRDLLYEYIDLAINNLQSFLVQVRNFSIKSTKLEREHLMVYLHSKLLRNITQFLEFKGPIIGDSSIDSCTKWIQKMVESSSELLHGCCNDQNLIPLTVESLAILNNLMSKIKSLHRNSELDLSNNMPQSKSPQMSLLFERLFVLNFSKLSVDNDDLLLILIIFLGTFAKNWDICDILDEKICSRILTSCNFILDNKTIDHEMISNTLYTLAQLFRHSGFLNKLKSSLSTSEQLKLSKTSISDQLNNLLDKFANLTLHGNIIISKFAILLLDQFRHLEGTQGSIFERRFSTYNSKWLDAMKASREGLLEIGINDIARYRKVKASSLSRQSEEDEPVDADDGDDFEHLKAVGDEGNLSERASPLYLGISREIFKSKDTDSGDDELDEDEQDEYEGPDLNVIDQNSMIKHLTTRKEFRSEWLTR